ncbi:MAG TPA: ATP-dependent 6-phosphofructokinase [Candidatus Sulfotelmatobacter sp.]|nr:ATP-dependent 6-phosphofructokinase [Candidatus Sulfotelmatobacter sp.]
MSDIRCVGIATGGGDAPGLNAVIRAAAKAAILKYQWKVIGIPDGFDGLIWPQKSFELTLDRVSGILPRGGTILGTTNRGNPFHYKTQENGQELVRDISDDVIANSKRLGIDAIITIGGDGSQKIGYELFQKGMKIVGVPKTIDNDLSATELTFGFDTALHTVTDAIDKIHTTAASHHRVMVVEVMGRDCGWIALAGGIAGGAHIILIPEIPFSMRKICEFIAQRESRGSRFTIVAVAEGIKLPPELKQMARGNPVGNTIGDAIGLFANKEVRVSVLGHIQRGGSPSPYDRVLATRFGVAAVDLVAEGHFGKMVALRADSIVAVDIVRAIGQLKTVRPDGELVRTARAIGIGFGD